MRGFTILHISDLHIGSVPTSSLEVLTAGVTAALSEHQARLTEEREYQARWRSAEPVASQADVRILVVSGDVVDEPTEDALTQAREYITTLSTVVDHTFIVPGNHDVKRYFGNFVRTEAFNKVFDTKADLLLRGIGLHLIGIDSTPASFARGAVQGTAYDEMVISAYAAESIPAAERESLTRIVVLHHHPLPLVTHGRKKLLAVLNEEDFLYLQNPATFLSACMECGASLVLHGHRHVEGFRRYSIQNNASISHYGADQWDDIHVLACPSSTGKEFDAGFNVISMSPDAHFMDVTRYVRPGNLGKFTLLDRNRPNGAIRVFLSTRLRRDVAVDVGARIALLPAESAAENALFPEIERLFRRRAFYTSPQRDWGLLLYAVVRTRLVWEQEVLPRLRERRLESADEVLQNLLRLENFVADQALQLDPHELSQITAEWIDNKDEFLRRLPRAQVSRHDLGPKLETERRKYLTAIQESLEKLGIRIPNLGAEWTGGGLDE